MAGAERADIIVQLSSISDVFLNSPSLSHAHKSRSTDCHGNVRVGYVLYRALVFTVKIFSQYVGKCVLLLCRCNIDLKGVGKN